MKFSRTNIFALITFTIAACNQPAKKVIAVTSAKDAKPVTAEPFKFHKLIEVAPGNYYDVFSWGRGTKDGARYIIMRSDSADQKFSSVSGDLEGPIQNVLNADLDTDGNPEIIIHATSIDTNRYTNVFMFEYNGDNEHKVEFPRLTLSQRKGYRGGDEFFIKESKLMRQFPIYTGNGAAATATGQKRLLEYDLRSNSLSAKQISTDSTSVAQNNLSAVATPQAATQTTKKTVKKHTVAKRKATRNRTSAKRRRRRG